MPSWLLGLRDWKPNEWSDDRTKKHQRGERPLHTNIAAERPCIAKGPIQTAGWALPTSAMIQFAYMNFMNLSLASSITCAVMVEAPRSLAMRSTSFLAIGRMKSGMFSSRCSASRDQVIPSGE